VIDQAVILVGGRGERLNDKVRFTPAIETPKPLVEVGGRPFIYYHITYLKGIGFRDIVLLVGYKREMFEYLAAQAVRLIDTQEDIDKAVLSIPNLNPLFLLMNGDCLPVMDFNILKNRTEPCTTMKIIGRDAGCAVVAKKDVESKLVSCGNIFDMEDVYESIMIWGGLHIGTVAGLQRARQFMDIIAYGA
jgi:GTP:adenosylcobinamide-phosphate guanylyltransferase